LVYITVTRITIGYVDVTTNVIPPTNNFKNFRTFKMMSLDVSAEMLTSKFRCVLKKSSGTVVESQFYKINFTGM